METQFPRRRASGNVRDQASAHPSAPPVDIQAIPPTAQGDAGDKEEQAQNGAPLLHEAKDDHQQGTMAERRERRSPRAFEAAIAIVLFALLSLSLFDNQSRSTFNLGSSESPQLGAGIQIALHPEDHVHRPPTRIELHWSVSTGFRAPDGVRKRVYLINGKALLNWSQVLILCTRTSYFPLRLRCDIRLLVELI